MNQDYKQLAKQALEEEKRREAELKARPLMLKKKFSRVSNEDLQTLRRNSVKLNGIQYDEVHQEIGRRFKLNNERTSLIDFEKIIKREKALDPTLDISSFAKRVIAYLGEPIDPNNKRWDLVKKYAAMEKATKEPEYEEPDYLKCDPSTGGCLFISLLVLGSALATIVISIIISIALTK